MTDATVAIVGGGITGLTAALHLVEHVPPERITLIERETRLGGKIHTERFHDFLIEAGPDSFLASKAGGMELCRQLGLTDELVGTMPVERRSYVRRAGRLHELPDGLSGLVPSRLGPLLTSSLLSWRGRARAGLDLILPRDKRGGEESIAGFIRRRLGDEAYDWLVEPLLSGIYAGDGASLSVDATFPQLRELERAQGSLLRGMARRPRKREPARSPFLAPRQGMGRIIEALETRLARCRLIRGTGLQSLSCSLDGYDLRLENGTVLRARDVVLATPALDAAGLIRSFDTDLAALLSLLPSVSTATLSLAYPASALRHPLRGYGYLRPRAEGGPLVACTWVTAKWPARAPAGFVLLRAFVGRAGHDEVVALPDGDLLALVREEFSQVLGITEEPHLSRVHRWRRGMPQYTLGHGVRLARIEARLAGHAGLHLAGHSYHGIGVPDCIRSGARAAQRVLARSSAVGA